MRTSLLALLFTACAATPPPVALVPPEPPPPPAAPAPLPIVTTLPSMLPAGQSAMPDVPAMAPIAAPVPTAPARPLARQAGRLEQQMRNCPTAVTGATTNASNTPFGVELTITADNPASQRRIIELAAVHESMGDPDHPGLRHTGRHGGPGTLGRCPVVHDMTTVTFTRLRKGVVIHLRALLPADVARVQSIVAERLAQLAEL